MKKVKLEKYEIEFLMYLAEREMITESNETKTDLYKPMHGTMVYTEYGQELFDKWYDHFYHILQNFKKDWSSKRSIDITQEKWNQIATSQNPSTYD